MGAILLLTLATLPTPGAPLVDRCDIAEISHVYDERGRKVFVQAVWWDYAGDGEHRVRAWRLAKCDRQGMRPRRDFEKGGWLSRWHDGDTFREVRADAFRETWMQGDPELENRKCWPKDKRRGLLNVGN